MDTKKPSYLGLLNAIALGEGRGHQLLSRWCEQSPDPDVRRVLTTVAIREAEHAAAFTKRLCELGYGVLDRPDPGFEKRLECVSSDRSDCEKFEALGYGRGGEATRDIFAGIFDDHSIDPQTGALLGRYVAEERDSLRLLRGCHETLRGRAGDGARSEAHEAGGAEARTLRSLHDRLDEVCAAIGKLQQEVAALRR
jgi:hypothetical protein